MPDNFLAKYLEYCEGSETPEIYDRWSAIATLVSVISRKVWIDQGYFRIYPNLYIVLVGPPGGRKTSAMNICKEILDELGNIPFAATCMTKEALCRYMATECVTTFTDPATQQLKTYTPITMILTELSHFLGANSAHMIDFLTTIYDQEKYDAKTKNKGDDIIAGPYLTILACTTPSNITRYLKEDVISGGFSRRTLFVYEYDDGDPIAFPTVTPEQAAAKQWCVDWCRKIQTVSGEFKWTNEARTWYQKWYVDLFNSLRTMTNQLTRGYYKSKHVQLLKLAMAVAMGESTNLVLDTIHLQVAEQLLHDMEKNLDKVYEGMGRNELNAVAANIHRLVESAPKGMLREKVILNEFFREADTRELLGIINHLISIGKLARLDETTSAGVTIKYLALPHVAEKLIAESQAKASQPPSTDSAASALSGQVRPPSHTSQPAPASPPAPATEPPPADAGQGGPSA